MQKEQSILFRERVREKSKDINDIEVHTNTIVTELKGIIKEQHILYADPKK